MKRLFALLWILLFLLTAFHQNVSAQENPPLAILEIDLRPEYDQPGVLVVYHMVLTPDSKLPAALTVRIPSNAGDPSLVAWVNPSDGSMNAIPYQITTGEKWNLVTFTTSALEVDFEYHDPSLTLEGIKRTYEFDWGGDYKVGNLSIYVQQPLGAKNMVILPGLGPGTMHSLRREVPGG